MNIYICIHVPFKLKSFCLYALCTASICLTHINKSAAMKMNDCKAVTSIPSLTHTRTHPNIHTNTHTITNTHYHGSHGKRQWMSYCKHMKNSMHMREWFISHALMSNWICLLFWFTVCVCVYLYIYKIYCVYVYMYTCLYTYKYIYINI